MNILGIETSCDETAAAVVENGRRVRSNVVYSQVAAHRPYGGVVPEIASRQHVERLPAILAEAVARAGIGWSEIDGVAATYGPGLATSLMVGLSAAKGLAFRLGKPLVGINHLEGHLYSVFLGDGAPDPEAACPLLMLLVSGGHTCLVYMKRVGAYEMLGETRDDAAGEALDKGATVMGLGYPGGPAIEKVARGGRRERVLLRHHASERVFGVQFTGRSLEDVARAAVVAVEAGAAFVDLNFGCPIDFVVRRGMGAAMLEKPRRVERVIAAVREAVAVPVFMKIRTGFREGKENAVAVARAGEAAGVDAITVHGRTREQRYRRPADWDRISEVAAAVTVPVIGNGDILRGVDAEQRLRDSGCTAVMAARGALIKPWIWEELGGGEERSWSSEERLALYRRWVELATENWGADEHGFLRIRAFLEFHLDFWRRYVPPGVDVEGDDTMQGRTSFEPRDALEELLQVKDDEALDRANELPDWAGALELSALLTALPTICVNRGDAETLERVRHIALSGVEDSGDVQKQGGRAALVAVVERAEGRPDGALASAKVALQAGLEMGTDSPLVRLGFSEAVDASFDLGEVSEAEELIAVIDGLRPSEVWPSLRALRDRAYARLMAARGEATEVDEAFRSAEARFRAIGVPYWLGGTLTEHGEWLAAHERSDEARMLLDEALGIFESLQARPWLERAAKLSTPAPAV